MKLFKVKGPTRTLIIEAATQRKAMLEYIALVCPMSASKATPGEVAAYCEDGNQIVRTDSGTVEVGK